MADDFSPKQTAPGGIFLHRGLLVGTIARLLIEHGEAVLQQPVDEDVFTAHLAQEDALSGIVEEILIVPGCRPIAAEHEPEGEVLETGTPFQI